MWAIHPCRRTDFTGLEVPPIVTSGLPGREYVLHAKDIGSLSIGSAVFYRHIAAGQVVAYSLDPSGDSVTIKVFINSPYDRFVTRDTRFWQASGIDMSIDSEGVKLHTESLASILEGGVAFQPIKGALPSPQSPVDSSFRALFGPGARHARAGHRGANLRDVFSRVAARTCPSARRSTCAASTSARSSACPSSTTGSRACCAFRWKWTSSRSAFAAARAGSRRGQGR